MQRYGFISGLYAGTYPTLIREISQFAVYYPIYEITLKLLFEFKTNNNKNVRLKKSEMSNFDIWISGACAGVGCWILTYPIDIVKTRMQASPHHTYNGFIDCGIQTFKDAKKIGFHTLFIGLAPAIYRAAILHSAIFLIYERVLSLQITKYHQIIDQVA